MTRPPGPTLRRVGLLVVVLVALGLAGLGLWRAATPPAQPTLQQQVDAVADTLRCPTCAGLSIADSSSAIAAGSQQVIEQQLRQGRTPDEIRQYFADRYGEEVLLSPDSSGPGLFVWVLPAVAVPAAGLVAWRRVRRGRRAGGDPPVGVRDDGVAEEAARALAAYRAGELVPDGTPSGEALREALEVRAAAEEDGGDPATLERADQRLAAAARRWAARSSSLRAAPARAARPTTPAPAGSPRAARGLPRRAVTVGAAVLVGLAAGAGLVLGARDRGAADVPTGDPPVAGSGATQGPVVQDPGAQPSSAAPPSASADELLAAAQQDPADPSGWVALGRAYDTAQRYPEALAAYERALALAPQADDVALLRAGVLVRSGRAGDALGPLRDLAGRWPDAPDVLLLLGLAQDATGDSQASATLGRFLELAPDSPAAPGVRRLLAGR